MTFLKLQGGLSFSPVWVLRGAPYILPHGTVRYGNLLGYWQQPALMKEEQRNSKLGLFFHCKTSPTKILLSEWVKLSDTRVTMYNLFIMATSFSKVHIIVSLKHAWMPVMNLMEVQELSLTYRPLCITTLCLQRHILIEVTLSTATEHWLYNNCCECVCVSVCICETKLKLLDS